MRKVKLLLDVRSSRLSPDDGKLNNRADYRRKHIYTRDLLYSVVENTLSARVPNYDTILDIDRKIREVSFPTAFQPYPKPEDIDYHSSAAGIRSFCHSQTRVIS